MKVINLRLKSSTKPQEISHYLGEPLKFSLANGGNNNYISGFTFLDPQHTDIKYKYKCNIVVHQKGIGVYFRNHLSNYLIAIQKDEITCISINKNSDVIKPYYLSLFSVLQKLGVHYEIAAKYLMPAEIIEESSATFQIKLEDTYFSFIIEKMTTDRIIHFFERNHYSSVLQTKILLPKYINR